MCLDNNVDLLHIYSDMYIERKYAIMTYLKVILSKVDDIIDLNRCEIICNNDIIEIVDFLKENYLYNYDNLYSRNYYVVYYEGEIVSVIGMCDSNTIDLYCTLYKINGDDLLIKLKVHLNIRSIYLKLNRLDIFSLNASFLYSIDLRPDIYFENKHYKVYNSGSVLVKY